MRRISITFIGVRSCPTYHYLTDEVPLPHDEVPLPHDEVVPPHDRVSLPRDEVPLPHDEVVPPHDRVPLPHDEQYTIDNFDTNPLPYISFPTRECGTSKHDTKTHQLSYIMCTESFWKFSEVFSDAS